MAHDMTTASQKPASSGKLLFAYTAGGAVLTALLLLLRSRPSETPLDGLSLTAFMAGGATVGTVLYFTRGWRASGPTARLSRWALGGAIAGAALILARVFDNGVSVLTVTAGAAVGALMIAFFGVEDQRIDYLTTRVDPRSSDEKVMQWGLLLGLAFLAFALLMLVARAA